MEDKTQAMAHKGKEEKRALACASGWQKEKCTSNEEEYLYSLAGESREDDRVQLEGMGGRRVCHLESPDEG
jgi:hypothetical protein